MTARSNTAAGVALLTELTAAQTAPGGDQFTSVTRTTSPSFTAVDRADGRRWYKNTFAAAADQLAVNWNETAMSASSYRTYCAFASDFTGTQVLYANTASGHATRIGITSAGAVTVYDASSTGGAIIYTSASGIVPFDESTVVIEYAVDIGTSTTTGRLLLRVWAGEPLGVVLDVELTGRNFYRGGTGITSRRFGKFTASGTGTYYTRDLVAGDSYALLGLPAGSIDQTLPALAQAATGDASSAAPGSITQVLPSLVQAASGSASVLPNGPFAVVVLTGASNMRGAATDYDATGTDAYLPDVWQYNASGPAVGTITHALEPLYHGDNTYGMGPTQTFTRDLVTGGETRPILLIPAARRGTGFTVPDSNGANLSWRIDLPDTSDNLFEVACDLITAALAATANGGQLVAILHNFGTTDSTANMTPATWTPYARALVQGLHTRLGSTVPFLMMQSRPDLMAAETRHALIDQAARDLVPVEPHTAYAYSPNGAGYFQPDAVHFNAAGQRVIGANLYAVLDDAVANLGTGTIAQTLPALTQSATGSATAPVYTAAIAQTVPALTQSATGSATAPVYTAAIAQILPAVTQSLAGSVTTPTSPGTVAQTLPALTKAANGSSAPPVYQATITSVLAALTQALAGSVLSPGATAPPSGRPVLTGPIALATSLVGPLTHPAVLTGPIL